MRIPRAVIAALESPDPTAWVDLYTADAVLMEPGEAPGGRAPGLARDGQEHEAPVLRQNFSRATCEC